MSKPNFISAYWENNQWNLITWGTDENQVAAYSQKKHPDCIVFVEASYMKSAEVKKKVDNMLRGMFKRKKDDKRLSK